ncbi:MAG: sigma-54 dependent transcriptional regulator [Thermodesulfobacteriota bacterium]
MRKHILIVEDDARLSKVLSRVLEKEGYEVAVAGTAGEGIEKLSQEMPGIVLTDIYLPDGTGMEILESATSRSRSVDVIVMTAHATVESAIQAMKAGARDYLLKPFRVEELVIHVRKIFECRAIRDENLFFKEGLKSQYGLAEIVGNAPAMREIFSLVKSVASSRSPVLIQGESGTGKDLIARAIHFGGDRAEKVFVPLNCSAIPENLLESELFGHVKGAYTGAAEAKRGLFEFAHEGTLFLDEIGDLSHGLQAKLLRAIEEGRIRRVGDCREIAVDVRIIAATNKEISSLMKNGEFREDLYYRMAVIPIRIPPLRERKEDLRMLTEHFVSRFQDGKRPAIRIGDQAMETLMRYDWPGNIRELKNLVERLSILKAGEIIAPGDLPPEFHSSPSCVEGDEDGLDYQKLKQKTLEDFHRRIVADALTKYGGNVSRASGALGLARGNFQRIMRRYGFQSSNYRDGE